MSELDPFSCVRPAEPTAAAMSRLSSMEEQACLDLHTEPDPNGLHVTKRVEKTRKWNQSGSGLALPLPDASLWVCVWTCDSVSDLLLMFVSMCDFYYF